MSTRSGVRWLPHSGWVTPRGRRGAASLFERDEELGRLEELFAGAAGGAGALVVVSGAVGMGKTALLHTAAERVADAGGLVLGATGVRAERAVPLGVINELFWSTPLPCEVTARMGALLDEVAFAAELAGLGQGTAVDTADGTAEPVRSRVMNGIWTVLRELSADAPVLVTVDDVHYADQASLQCLLYFVRRLRSSRVLVVLAESEHSHRDNPLFRTELLRERRCERIHLGRLSAHGVGHMAGARLDAAAAAELTAFSGGNPLLVRALLADQRAVDPERWGRSRTGLLVGDAFGQAVTSCVHRVEPKMLAAVRGLALLGAAAEPESLAQLLDVDVEVAARAVRGLQDAGLLSAGWFRHSAAATAVLDSLSERDRRDGHRRIALLLHDEGASATVIARHLVAAGHVADEWVLPVLREAAEQARMNDDNGFAVECLDLATAACVNEMERAAVTMELAKVQWLANPASAARYLGPLTKALLGGHLPAGEAAGLARALLWHGRADAAAEVLAHSEAAGADLLVVDQWLRSCWPELRTPPSTGSAPAPRVSINRPLQAATVLADVLVHGTAAVDVDGVVAVAERVLQCGHLDEDGLVAIEAALLALVYADRPDLAARWCAPLLERAAERGAATWQARLSAVQADIALRRGDAPGAVLHARAALSLIPLRSWGVAIGAPLATLVLALLAMGRIEEAGEQLNQPVPPAMARTRFGLLHRYARGRHHLVTERLHAALADFLACGEQMAKWGMDLPALVPWRAGAAEVYLRFGEPEQARQLVEEQLTRPGAGRSRTRGASLRVLAAASEPGQRPRLLWQAVEALRDSEDRLETAGALADLSRVHEALGETARARSLAEQAVELAEECEAEPLLRTLQRQDASGSPGRDDRGRPAVLSDAEQRVASLVARGHTNREVSQALFITVSTVEQHLTRIYRKLDVSGRSDLAACLELEIGVSGVPLGAVPGGDVRGVLASMKCGFDQFRSPGEPGG